MAENNTAPKYNVGDIIYLKVDSSRKGPIIQVLPSVRGQHRYKVFHSPDDIYEYLENQIAKQIYEPSSGVGNALDAMTFIAKLNSTKLSFPQIDSLYSLNAARIKFIPFQFKPLLKFIHSEVPRILIADEVGVGKTIEAGLILRELESRQELKNVLIVCPKALVHKWRLEMKRFDEDFEILTADTLKYCIRETQQDGVWPVQYGRAIVHIELLRREEYLNGFEGKRYRPGLLELNPPPQFDMLIVDEAHHLRTPESNTHKMAQFFCEISEAAVFLSATPMQLGSINLFTLLNLLRPDQFMDERVFQEMVIPNRYINEAIKYVRTKNNKISWQTKAYEALQEVLKTPWGKQAFMGNAKFLKWIDRLGQSNELSNEERITFLRDMEDVHTVAHIINRTRRRDIGSFTIREPFTVSVPFTTEQQSFYQNLLDFKREVLALTYDQSVIRLITDTLERQVASCLPALIPMLDSFIITGSFKVNDLTDDVDADDLVEDNLPKKLIDKARILKSQAKKLCDVDPKLDELKNIVSETLSKEGPGKILIFSYFIHTLNYLERNLSLGGYRVAIITGRVDDEQREELRKRFRLDRTNEQAIDILLSSEVGCEGLDYEFCNRLVNYDIPWNPMRIEQRIGRIDRFGQKSEKVQIYNFITPGTIEERIFFRCFERLGIFKETIGDMEEILGKLTEGLTEAAFDTTLTPEQAEEKSKQMADNVLRFIEEQRRLDAESSELLSMDNIFQDEIDKIKKEERFITPEIICELISLFMQNECSTAKILIDNNEKRLYKLRASRNDKDRLLEKVYNLGKKDKQTIEFTRWLESNELFLPVTFDQETALEFRDVVFITPVHPLTKIAVSYWNNSKEQLFTKIQARSKDINSGSYIFAYFLWESVSIKRETKLIPLVWNLKEHVYEEDLSKKFNEIIRSDNISNLSSNVTQSEIEEGLYSLDGILYDKRAEALKDLSESNKDIIRQRLASMNRYFEQKLFRIEEELKTTTNRNIGIMKESERNRVRNEWERKKLEYENMKNTDVIIRRIAYGIIEVINDDD